MTDRELVELAARAAGIVGKWVSDYDNGDYYYQGNVTGIYREYEGGGFGVWNPITDDGDALRLAVDLGITSVMRVDDGAVQAIYPIFDGAEIWEWFGDDKYCAARRAIVRAAAEIGMSTPDPSPDSKQPE